MTDLPDLMASPTLTIDVLDDTRFKLTGGTFVHKERISMIPGSRFVGRGEDFWTIPRAWTSITVLARLFKDNLNWTAPVVEWANSIWAGIIEPALQLRNEGAKPEWIEAIGAGLPDGILTKDYQVAGALYLATAKRASLFDVQGTGKMTQTALTLSLYPDTLPALVVCPKSVLYTWQAELAKFGVLSIVVDGSVAERRKAFETFAEGKHSVLIISYGLMLKHSRVAGYGTIKLTEDHRQHKELQQTQWATVIADEGHRIKDPTAVQTRAVWACREHARYVWALTGTPIEKNIVDLWALLHFMDPVEWPSKTKYIDLWVMTAPGHFGGVEILGLRPDLIEEFRGLTEWHWRRQLASEEMPPVVYDLRIPTLPAKAQKAYKDMKKQLMVELQVGESELFQTLFAANHMTKAGRLHMMASATVAFDAEDPEKVRMIEPSWKLDAVQDAMKDYPDTPIIFWFNNRDLLHMFETRLDKDEIRHVAVHGDITGRDRFEAVDSFQRGDVDCILVTYGAGSEGTTLTRSPVAFRVQRPLSSIKDQQAPFRNRRIGSEHHEHITYVDFVTRGTYEENVIANLDGKTEAQQEVLRDHEVG